MAPFCAFRAVPKLSPTERLPGAARAAAAGGTAAEHSLTGSRATAGTQGTAAGGSWSPGHQVSCATRSSWRSMHRSGSGLVRSLGSGTAQSDAGRPRPAALLPHGSGEERRPRPEAERSPRAHRQLLWVAVPGESIQGHSACYSSLPAWREASPHLHLEGSCVTCWSLRMVRIQTAVSRTG